MEIENTVKAPKKKFLGFLIAGGVLIVLGIALLLLDLYVIAPSVANDVASDASDAIGGAIAVIFVTIFTAVFPILFSIVFMALGAIFVIVGLALIGKYKRKVREYNELIEQTNNENTSVVESKEE